MTKSSNPYYGTVESLNKDLVQQITQGLHQPMVKDTQMMFAPNQYMRSDNLPVDEELDQIKQLIATAQHKKDKKQIARLQALLSRTESLSDLTPKLYQTFNENKNTFSNWYLALKQAVDTQSFFKIPKTKYLTLPLELSQFIRHDYADTNQCSRDAFNQLLIQAFQLELDKEYFIKTGVFSSKFEFANAHCTDPKVLGDYFIVIQNFAMLVGAGRSNDIVVREWIPDPENRPTIYDGMPLRTEFRAFIDFDTQTLLGVVEYWHPVVMKNTLRNQGQYIPEIQTYYQTYKDFEDTLHQDFNQHVGLVAKHIKQMIPSIPLTGAYALDVMKSGEDYYVIDMSLMEDSALTSLLQEGQAYL